MTAEQQQAMMMLMLKQLIVKQQQQEQKDPMKQLAELFSGKEEKPKTMAEQMTALLSGQQEQKTQEQDPMAALAALFGGKKKEEAPDINQLIQAAITGKSADITTAAPQFDANTGALFTAMATQLDALTKKLDDADTSSVQGKVRDTFIVAAKKAGIVDEGKLADVTSLHAAKFGMQGEALVLMGEDGKPVMRQDNPLLPVDIEQFHTTLKKGRPDYYASAAADTNSLESLFGFEVDGKPVTQAGDKVEIDITNDDWQPTEDQAKAIAENRHSFVVNGVAA